MKIEKELRAVAYHEAGHAVVNKINKIRNITITIIPDGDSLGRVTNEVIFKNSGRISPYSNRLKMERTVQACLAGSVSQQKFEKNHKYRQLLPYVCQQDYDMAYSLVSCFCGSDAITNAYLKLLYLQTKLFIDNQETWAAIKGLAALLVIKKNLSGREMNTWFRKNHPFL